MYRCRYTDTLSGSSSLRSGRQAHWWKPCQTEPVANRGVAANSVSVPPKEYLGSRANTSNGPFWTVEDRALVVRKRYGVEYQSRTSCNRLLHLCGLSFQETEKVFKSRSEMKVADFEEQLEKKLIDVVQNAPQTVFLAGDEAGLYLQTSTCQVWSPTGQTPVVRADPGRAKTDPAGTHQFKDAAIGTRRQIGLAHRRPHQVWPSSCNLQNFLILPIRMSALQIMPVDSPKC